MRPRKKKHTDERLERCAAIWVQEEETAGRWQEIFGNDHPLRVEIGCGKGTFAVESAKREPDVNFVALEREKEVIVMAMEKAVEAGLTNLRFMLTDAEGLEALFAPQECERIYLNFSDPWPKSKQAKRRLTYHTFLARYRRILQEDGAVFFKTDNRPLFDFSLEEFTNDGWRLENVTFDLHHSGFEGNIMTEYEARFVGLGQPIHRLEAYLR